MIETRSLTRDFGNTRAVSSLDLRVEPGEIFGFLGPNGAGKTTTVKMLTGMLRPTSGTARVAGFDVVEEPLEVKRRIGYVPEAGALYESLTAGEFLDVVANLHHLDEALAGRRIAELLEMFGIADARNRRLAEFSKGMKQKVLIASALLSRPDVLFLDEPLSGVDANTALVVKELVKGLVSRGKTVFFCSHILEVVERICTRIVIIADGEVAIEGTAAQIVESTGTSTLEEAFSRLTGVRDAGETTAGFLAALEEG